MEYIYKGKYFSIRKYKKGDEESTRKNINDKEICRNLLVIPYPYTPKDAKKWVKSRLKSYKKRNPDEISFVIEIDKKAVGGMGIRKVIKSHKAEIGYWLGRKYWGRGIMTEAVKQLTDYAFKRFKLKRVYAEVFSFNKASSRVLEKAGFKCEGLHKKEVLKNDKYFDCYVWAKIK